MSEQTLVVSADISAALAAAAKLQSANDAQIAAAKQLAAAMSEAERANIAAMRASQDVAKQAAADRREAISQARAALAVAKEQQAQARVAMAEQARLARAAIADERRIAFERERGFARAEMAAAKYTAELKKQQAVSAATSGRGLAIGGAVGLGIAGARAGFDLVDQAVDRSHAVESVSKNLQLDIRAARAELGGLVTDYDLALAANRAFAMDVADTGAEFAHIVGMVSEQAQKMGIDQAQAVNDAIQAIGKQEAEIWDNLGAGALRITDAYQIYAESVGKAASELTQAEKAAAFKKAAILTLEKATGRATVSVDGFTRSWKEFGVEFDNVTNRVLGFDDEAGRVNEALRELSDEQLDRLRFAEALNDEDAKRMDSMGRTAREMQGHIDDWGLSIMDLKEHADAQGISYLQMLTNAKQAHADLAAEQERQRIEAEKMTQVAELTAEAESTEHLIALMTIEGAKRSDIMQMEIDSLTIQREAAEIQAEITKSTEDQAKVLQLTRAIELAEAKKAAPKGGGRARDPNERLDRETSAALHLLETQRQILEVQQSMERNTTAHEQQLLTLAREELAIRERAAAMRVVRGAEASAKHQAELLDIATEKEVQRLEFQRTVIETERTAAEERLVAMDRQIELLAAEGVAVELLERRRAEANIAFAETYGSRSELVQAQHEQAMLFAEQETAQREADAKRREELHKRELARIAEQQKRRQQAMQATNQLMTAGFGLLSAVTDATIKDEKKRERASLRARGVEAMARGALETVEAVAAFASFNYVQGALHVAAAATAFATGIPMLAGKVPQGGAAGASGASAEPHQTDLGPDFQGGQRRDLPSTPASAEELQRLRGATGPMGASVPSGKGGDVINIYGPVVSGDAGSLLADMDSQNAKKWGAA